MPGRTGYRVEGGWAQDGTSSSGVLASLSINSRTNNTPAEYIASQEIEFIPGFESGTGDSFEAYITDGSSIVVEQVPAVGMPVVGIGMGLTVRNKTRK